MVLLLGEGGTQQQNHLYSTQFLKKSKLIQESFRNIQRQFYKNNREISFLKIITSQQTLGFSCLGSLGFSVKEGRI